MTLTTFYGDLETFCEKPIKHGTYQYAEACEAMLFPWALDEDPVDVWDITLGEMAPDVLVYSIEVADIFVFHNSMFDRSVLRLAANIRKVLSDAAWRQITDLDRWVDTMVQAYAHSLPGGLEKLCEVLKVPLDQQKLTSGRDYINLFCKPLPAYSELRRATRLTHPKEWAGFRDEYAPHDILAMRQVFKRCPRWNYP